jgi:hypothetical protein
MTTLDHYDRAMQACAADLPRWRALNRAAAELREGASVYQPYPARNKALVKALRISLEEKLITHADFACCLANVRGEWL